MLTNCLILFYEQKITKTINYFKRFPASEVLKNITINSLITL